MGLSALISRRMAYASAAHELGLDELTIKAFLGHARLGVTKRLHRHRGQSRALPRQRGLPVTSTAQ